MSTIKTKQGLLEPWQVLAQVIKTGEPIPLASRLHISDQLVRAWRREPEGSAEYESTGRLSPLDRLTRVIEFIKAKDDCPSRAYPLGHYIAGILGGVFVPLGPLSTCADSEFLAHISSILKESAEVVERARKAYLEESPGRFDNKERRELRSEISEAIAALHRLQQWIEGKADD